MRPSSAKMMVYRLCSRNEINLIYEPYYTTPPKTPVRTHFLSPPATNNCRRDVVSLLPSDVWCTRESPWLRESKSVVLELSSVCF